MQPSTKVRRKNGRNGREGSQHVTRRIRAGIDWAAEFAALERALNDPNGNVVRFGRGPEELAIKEFQWS